MAARHRNTELRSKWWSRPAGHLVWFFITLVCFTLRKRIIAAEEVRNLLKTQPVIIALWHNRTFVPCYVYKYVIKGKVTMSMLTSASKDGTVLATVAEDYGMRAVRGSSGRRGVAGFLDMVREVRSGCSMCITPDGPKGPRYKSHPGVIKLAAVSGVPIIPICIEVPSCWRLRKAWDAFIIPKPFSRVNFKLQEPISVPSELDDEGIRQYAARLDEALACGTPDFEPLQF